MECFVAKNVQVIYQGKSIKLERFYGVSLYKFILTKALKTIKFYEALNLTSFMKSFSQNKYKFASDKIINRYLETDNSPLQREFPNFCMYLLLMDIDLSYLNIRLQAKISASHCSKKEDEFFLVKEKFRDNILNINYMNSDFIAQLNIFAFQCQIFYDILFAPICYLGQICCVFSVNLAS